MGLFGGYNLPTGGTGATGYPGTTAIQDFTTNSTWSKCPGAVYVKVISIGGGGGGGNGLNAPSTITGAVVLGGAGGGGGGISEQTFAACAIGATASVIIGAGGGISINQAGSGGASRWCTTAGCDVCAAGGKGGYGGRDLYPTYGAFHQVVFQTEVLHVKVEQVLMQMVTTEVKHFTAAHHLHLMPYRQVIALLHILQELEEQEDLSNILLLLDLIVQLQRHKPYVV